MKNIDRNTFAKELERLRKGSISRREFLRVTGLGMATTVMASGMAGSLMSAAARAGEKDIGDRVALATWPNYHDAKNFNEFAAKTGANVQVNVFGSNEEMLAKLQAGGTGWDVFVPTNYTISTYVELGLIEPLDVSRLPNFRPEAYEKRFMEQGIIDGKVYAVPKNWGTTGIVFNSKRIKSMTSWKDFFDVTRDYGSGGTIVHDYQLTTIGNALKYFGFSFNSCEPAELAKAEALLLDCKPHLYAITSDYQPPLRNGDAWMSMCWTGDGSQLHRDMPEMKYILGREGGELWSDFYAIPKSAEHKDAAYALINHLLAPTTNAAEVLAHGYPSGDSRVDALLPKTMLEDPIMYPAAELLSALEFGAAATLINPDRAELIARFKSA